MIKIKKGLNLPVSGAPDQVLEPSRPTRSVALLGSDYPGMRPTMLVKVGDTVKRGQPLFEDKKNPGVVFTATQAGTVASINRGAKRVLQSVVIDVQGTESVAFAAVGIDGIGALAREQVVENLVASGLWTALRKRPYSKIPAIQAEPRSVFVTAIDTNPLAADPAVVIPEYATEFAAGLDVLAKLTAGPVYVCQEAGKFLPAGTDPRLSVQEFSGIHPAGLPGTHIHFLDPVGPRKSVWFIGYQDVIAVGHLFMTGEVMAERVVALGGPGVVRPRLLKTVLGADLDELTAGELHEGEQRVISGSVFSGRAALSPSSYLGRYHVQVSVLPEDRKRRLLGYLTPGLNKHSVFPIYLSRLFGTKELQFSTTTNGSPRAMVPIGTFESVMPLDILPTQLLRSLLVGDLEAAMNLGCLELDEDDIALCTYACPGKYEYGPVLRDVLTQIEKEG
jgi:Na+-transporting NADH:ubiquinone oxidoreductase subunit A